MSTHDQPDESESPTALLVPYEKPSIDDLGSLVDLTHMPGGGFGAELDGGNS